MHYRPMFIVNEKKEVPDVYNATIEHLHPRGHPKRQQYYGHPAKALACQWCNSARSNHYAASLDLRKWITREEREAGERKKRIIDQWREHDKLLRYYKKINWQFDDPPIGQACWSL